METQYISIREFAALVGVSVQSIYKKINKEDNPLRQYVKDTEQGRLISKEAASLYGIEQAETIIDERIEENPTQLKAESNDINDKLIAILETQMEELKRQLIEKDKQLAEKDNQIMSLLLRLEENAKIIQQQQTLTAMNTQLFTKQLSEPDESVAEEEIVSTDTVRKSFWGMFRKRN